MPTDLLKRCMKSLIPHLSLIINASIREGVVPDQWKLAHIVPLLKKLNLDIESLTNFRPVSNLPFLSKLCEKVVLMQFHEYLKENNLYDKFQSAYKDMHSTETALVRVQNDMLMSVDEGHPVILVALDLSSAFDTVDHCKLISRLERTFGIQGNALKWFQSYLSNRKQAVRIDDTLSDWHVLSSGVPQGSILGPVLFSVYIHPLSDIITNSGLQYHAYADDTQLYIKCTNIKADLKKLEEGIVAIRRWLTTNHLQLNDSKTEVMLISTPQMRTRVGSITLRVGNEDISPASTIKNLGVIMDQHLTMEANVNQIVRICFANICNIARIRKFLDKQATESLVYSLVVSRLDYANALCYGMSNYLVKKLRRVQNATGLSSKYLFLLTRL